jgi:hypothetical protein
MAEPTSYERLGGIFAIAAVVNNFSGYGVVVTGGGRPGQTVQLASSRSRVPRSARSARSFCSPFSSRAARPA